MRPFVTALMMTGLLALGPLAAVSPAFARDTTRTSVDWAGAYEGVISCAGCPAIATRLALSEPDGYTLTQGPVGQAGTTVSGRFQWDRSGRVITLDKAGGNRKVFVSEGYVEWVDLSGKGAPAAALRMNKTALSQASAALPQVFRARGEMLRLKAGTLDTATDGRVRFNALWNFPMKMQGGHRSLKAAFVINCKAGTYAMPKVAYYRGADGRGRLVERVDQPQVEPNPIPPGDDVIALARTALCR